MLQEDSLPSEPPGKPLPISYSAQQPPHGLSCDFVGIIHPETQGLSLISEAGTLRMSMWMAEVLLWGMGTVVLHLIPGLLFDSCGQNNVG